MTVIPRYLVSFLAVAMLSFMVAHSVQAEIFVTTDSGNEIQVFSDSASGSDAPLRSITVGWGARGIFVDPDNGEIFVAFQNDRILVFDIDADGAALPLRSINQDSSASVSDLGDFQGVHVDVANNEIFVANRDGSVTVFNRTDSGTLAPKRSLYGGNTGLVEPRGIFVQGDELFVADNSYPYAVRVFTRSASGNTAPLRVITNTASPSMGEVSQLLVANGEVTVADFGSLSIRTWPSNANGDVVPSRMISGVNTQLAKPRGVALCENSDTLVVGNRDGDMLTFYSVSANGNVAPTKTLDTLAGPRFVSCVELGVAEPTSVPVLPLWALIGLSGLLIGTFGLTKSRRRRMK